MENIPEWAVADYAILAIGAVTVPLYCSYRPQDMVYVLRDAGAKLAMTTGGKVAAQSGSDIATAEDNDVLGGLCGCRVHVTSSRGSDVRALLRGVAQSAWQYWEFR